MAVSIQWVDLTPPQLATISRLTPTTDKVIEQIKPIATGGASKTYVRVGTGRNKREWLVLRNGRAVANPTPGRGRVRP